jgi:HD-GYP domain-containing protein (c-di-GMP phosphodiesterase class II)
VTSCPEQHLNVTLLLAFLGADTEEMQRQPTSLHVLVGVSLAPVLVLWIFGGVMVMPPLWVHFYGVGVSALTAAAAAVALMVVGARRGDARTVVVAGGFTVMAALLAVHGLVTPGVLVGRNGVIALTGAATLPVGAAVLALSGMQLFNTRRSIPPLLALVAAVVAVIVSISLLGVLVPRLVPAVPEARSPAAWILLAIGLALFGALAVRAAKTYLLTRRAADLAVVVGLVLLACSLYGALALTFMDLGWWLGHVFELVGISLVGASVAYDLHRGSQSRPLAGDLRASELVAAEEAFLGARVRALMVRLAEKDSSTEEHTRRVATLAVEVGEQLGLSAARLRDLAIGGLLHDVGKLSIPAAILQKPGQLDDAEFDVIKLHPARGRELLEELGGFPADVTHLVLDHHERLDGSGYPHGLKGNALDLETRILAVCDVYDALVSPRVYRGAWPPAKALHLLHEESGTAFDPRCVAALVRLVSHDRVATDSIAS